MLPSFTKSFIPEVACGDHCQPGRCCLKHREQLSLEDRRSQVDSVTSIFLQEGRLALECAGSPGSSSLAVGREVGKHPVGGQATPGDRDWRFLVAPGPSEKSLGSGRGSLCARPNSPGRSPLTPGDGPVGHSRKAWLTPAIHRWLLDAVGFRGMRSQVIPILGRGQRAT